MATRSSILAWNIPWTEVAKSLTRLSTHTLKRELEVSDSVWIWGTVLYEYYRRKKQTSYEKSSSIFFKEHLREMNIQTLSWVRAAGQTPRTRRGPTQNASDGIQEVNSTQRIILYSLSKKSTVKHLANEGQYSTFWRGLRATKTQLGNTICT